jgi:hypothetical protein
MECANYIICCTDGPFSLAFLLQWVGTGKAKENATLQEKLPWPTNFNSGRG